MSSTSSSDLIVSKLKSLPPNRAALLQLKIQELLSREIIGQDKENGDDGSEDDAASDANEDEEETEVTVQVREIASTWVKLVKILLNCLLK